MIFELLSSKKYFFLSDRSDASNMQEIKGCIEQLNDSECLKESYKRLNFLTLAFLFRHFSLNCDETFSATVLEDVKSPTYRAARIQTLPAITHRLLHAYAPNISNKDLCQSILIPTPLKKEATYIASHSPFGNEQLWIADFEDLQKKCDIDQFSAILIAAIFKQHIEAHTCSAEEKHFFHKGLSTGHIAMHLAKDHGHDPVKHFLLSIIRCVGYIYLHRELRELNKLPAKQPLLSELSHIGPKFIYWIAKDWGMSDDIQFMLKESFQYPEDLSLSGRILQKSEHANFAIMLYQEDLFNQQQLTTLLDAMQLGEHDLMQAIITTTH